MKQLSEFRSHLYCLLTIAIWSTLEVVGKLLGTSVSPYAITAWRFLIGGLVILPFALRNRGDIKLGLKGIAHLSALGILNVCLAMLILQLSIHYGKASVSAVIISVNPLFVAMFAMLLLKEKMGIAQVLGLILGVTGIVILVLGEVEMRNVRYLNLPLGIGLAIVAALAFGTYTVLTRAAVARYGNLLSNSTSFLAGSISLFAYNIIAGEQLTIQPTLPNLLLAGYLGLILTGLAYLLYFEGMKRIGAGKASMYFFTKPLISTFLAWMLLGETLRASQLAAVVLIVSAMNLPRLQNLFSKGTSH
ncbi:MAG TPA: DMT family transporter [Candidatus Cloacimonadota bacterium]|nr:DMT family transporter [Candidatus Cloacimonadota bacterium]